jgi:sulfate permease, SulP family
MNFDQKSFESLLQNLIAALTVSFAAISLGAAFGLASGRGAFAGIISAGIIALITALLGGTRVQCSGPTAPMTAITIVIVAFASTELSATMPHINPHHFINAVFILTGVCLLIVAVLRLGFLVKYVPNVVVSGFMNGIAILIWLAEIKKIFGFAGTKSFEGPILMNLVVAAITCALIFLIPRLIRKIPKNNLLSATLLAIIVMSAVTYLLKLPIETTRLNTRIDSIQSVVNIVSEQMPVYWSLDMFTHLYLYKFVFTLTLLCYLDSLLTSLVVDKFTGEETSRNKELAAQGVANAAIALFGGIPGAQATIRSVLIIKEKATFRYAGIMVGVFVLIEMVIFQDWINYIPKAVFSGVLLKVGWDVFDKDSALIFWKQLKKIETGQDFRITGIEMWLFIAGTTIVTVLLDLNIAVGSFSVLFYLFNRFLFKKNPLQDMKAGESTPAESN